MGAAMSTMERATARMTACRRVLEALADQREALEHRLWREDPDDTLLEGDVQTFGELARAIAAFLEIRRAR
jgi:hypothetical protein